MPRHTPYLLCWSSTTQKYELSASSGPVPTELTSATWLTWLDEISSFAFHSQSGAYCTVRKEIIQGKGAYWYGYRSLQRRTVKRYLGRTVDLSLARLEKVTESFVASNSIEAVRDSGPEQLTPNALPRNILGQASIMKRGEEGCDQGPFIDPLAGYCTLEAKLHPPRLPQTLIKRPRLYARLDTWSSHKLTLLSAPAGSGKTTLVNAWLAQNPLSAVAWITLDSRDNDPIRFWYYLLMACQSWTSSTQQQILVQLQTMNPANLQPQSLESVLSHFLNQLHKEACLLILEDYHVIMEPRIHESFDFLLRYLPETLHVLVMTRHDPPYVLGRLRINGEINELQAKDLRFSYDETVALLQQTLTIPVSANMLEQLETHLNGWPAGLRLLTHSLQDDWSEAQIEHFLTTLRGSHRPIRDYFVAEVLHTQPQEIQDFLLHTSFLARLSPSLCAAVTGCRDSTQLLETIEHCNLFLEALDGSGEWYRYHTLFAEAMQHEARRHLGAQEIIQLLQAASRWFADHGLLVEAIETALKLEERDQAAYLIELHVKSLPFIEIYELHTLRRWLEQIPETTLRQHPLLSLSFAVALVFTRDQQESEALHPEHLEHFLRMAEEGWQDDSAELGKVLAFRAFFGLQQGMRAQTLTWARQALAWLPEEETMWRGMSLIALGVDALQAGRLHEARPHFQKIHRSWKPSGNAQILDGMTIILGMICLAQGELYQAAHYYRELGNKPDQAEDHPISAASHLALAVISYEWNTLDSAEQQLQEGVRQTKLLTDGQQEPLSVLAEFIQALLHHAQGETVRAIQRLTALLMRGRERLQPAPNELFLFLYQEVLSRLVRYALLLGDHATAQHWINDLARQHAHPAVATHLLAAPSTATEPDVSQEEQIPFQQEPLIPPLLQEGRALLMARLYLAQGDAEVALTLLLRLLPEAQAAGRGYTTLQIRLLLAQAYAIRKRSAEAQQMLLEGLEQGYVGGYQRSFLDEGDQLFLLLHDLFPRLQSPPLREYVQSLFRAFRLLRRETRVSPVIQALFEPLSKQEQRVLRLLVTGRSNQEIAQELVVSINTIRTQVQSIYHKLQVNNRQAASEIARNLNLL